MGMPARLHMLLCVLQIHHDIVDEAIRLSYQGDRLSPDFVLSPLRHQLPQPPHLRAPTLRVCLGFLGFPFRVTFSQAFPRQKNPTVRAFQLSFLLSDTRAFVHQKNGHPVEHRPLPRLDFD